MSFAMLKYSKLFLRSMQSKVGFNKGQRGTGLHGSTSCYSKSSRYFSAYEGEAANIQAPDPQAIMLAVLLRVYSCLLPQVLVPSQCQ